ncbi:Nn.00g030720.m01.CDS01 [Neocucurbitaria sp. VM-36]
MPETNASMLPYSGYPTHMLPNQGFSSAAPQLDVGPTCERLDDTYSTNKNVINESRFLGSSPILLAQPDIPHINLIEPTPPSLTSASQAWRHTHSWIDPGRAPSCQPQSPFLINPQHQITPTMVTLLNEHMIVPRPIDEYKAILDAMKTGNFDNFVFATQGNATHHVQMPQQMPSKICDILCTKGDAFGHIQDILRASEPIFDQGQTAKRKRSVSLSSPTLPLSKRMRVGHAQPEAAPSWNQPAAAIAPDHGRAAPSLTPTAAQLIGRHKAGRRWKNATPWGLKRILTQKFIEQQAITKRVPIPIMSDNDVRDYCNFSALFDPVHSMFPPESLDIRLLGTIEISAEELLTFFPNHLKWHDAVYRLAQNSWSCSDMANYINYTRDLSSRVGKRGNTILKWLQAADQRILGLHHSGSTGRNKWKTTCFTAQSWAPYTRVRRPGLVDYHLVDLADGVVRWPEGEGARLLTRAVRHAIVHGNRDVRLSQIQGYIRGHLLMFPLLKSMVAHMRDGKHPDVLANERSQGLLWERKQENRV